MRLRSIVPVCLVLTLACGDDGGGGGTTGAGSTGPGSTGPGATGPGSTGTTAGSGSGTATTMAASGDTTATSEQTTTSATGDTTAGTGPTTSATSEGTSTGASTTGGMGSLDADMTVLDVYQDCMPIVAPDPVNASFTLSLTNTGDAAASATVTSAAFLDAGGAQVATLDVTPAMFGPIAAGDSSMTMVTKVPNSLMPANGCEVLQCGQSYTLELVLDVDGVEVVASDIAMVGCVF